MAEYKISLGVQLQTDDIVTQINEAERKIDPIKIKVDAETKELTRSIQDALKTLSGGTKNALTLDTSKFEGSIADIKSAVVDLKKVLGSLDDSANMKSLLASVNQIANAIGKVTDESETLVKSLSILSKKDFGFNFNLKTGNANPIKAATDYGIEARRKAIPAMQEQVAFLQNIIGGTEKADKALERYLVKQNKGFGGVREKERLQREMLGGVDLDGKSVSISKQMGAYEQTISILKKIAIESGKSLDGFDAHFSKAAENIVDDTVKIQTGVKQTEEALESAANEMKQIFSMGVGADQLSAQLDPIVQDLKQIREAVQNLSKGVSLDGLTSSFDRLSGAIENLLANAEKVKGVLNSGFDVGKVGGTSTTIDTSAINKIEKASDDATAAVVQNEKKKREAYKATTDTVLYHAGVISKLNKAETNGRFYGSNRGTGYFGTGHYFVDSSHKHELDNDSNYNTKPYTSVDISKYDNLFKATTDNVASNLHSFLHNLTEFTRGSDKFSVSELFEQFKNVFGDTVIDIKDFGNRLEQLKSYMTNSMQILRSEDRSDSVSTQFMKSLGYEGVDTRGTRYADTYGGTVIYDLKEESILQANITDELQKQGQMLEKINYAKGQVFDKDTDARIQNELDAQAKKREIANEFKNSFDATNLNKANSDLNTAQSRLKEIDGIICDLEKGVENAEQDVQRFAREMAEFGIDMSDEDIREQTQNRVKDYRESIDELSEEKTELQSKIPILEEVYNKEQQLANEAYKQAEQTVEQRHREAQQAQETANAVDQLANAHQNAAKVDATANMDGDFKEANIQIKATEEQVENLQTALKSFGFDDSAIKAITDDIEKVGFEVKEITHQLDSDGSVKITVKGVDDLQRAVTAIKSVRMIDDPENEGDLIPSIKTTTKIKQNLDDTAQSFKKLKSLAKEMGDLDIKIAGLEADGKIDEANSLRRVLDGLKSDYQELYLVTEKNLSTDQIKELDQIFANTSGEVREFKQELAEAAKTQELTSGLERLKSIAQEINGLKIELFKAEDTGNIERITNRLNELENESSELRAELQQKFPTASFDQIDDIARKGEEAVAQLVNKVAEAKAKLAQGIKLKISDTGFNGFEQEVLRARNAAEELEGVYPDLESALKRLDAAMADVYSADEARDVKRLIAANEEYEASLKQVYSQLKLYQQAEQKAYKAEMLNQKKSVLSSEMETWLKENTRAARDFGEEIRRLQASLNGLDDKGVKLVGQQFKAITKHAQAMGKTGLTVFDRLKSKVKEYMTYLSAAEMFMWIEQAFREMFNTVKEIDTAMTGLYRVTDLTAAEYDNLFNNMISSAKEYGATLNDIINATTDWVRAGFDANTSLGLAEVTTMYQHISDLDYDTAAENLITAYNGFKDELNGAFSGDTVSAVNYIADILNELDKQNCPLVV